MKTIFKFLIILLIIFGLFSISKPITTTNEPVKITHESVKTTGKTIKTFLRILDKQNTNIIENDDTIYMRFNYDRTGHIINKKIAYQINNPVRIDSIFYEYTYQNNLLIKTIRIEKKWQHNNTTLSNTTITFFSYMNGKLSMEKEIMNSLYERVTYYTYHSNDTLAKKITKREDDSTFTFYDEKGKVTDAVFMYYDHAQKKNITQLSGKTTNHYDTLGQLYLIDYYDDNNKEIRRKEYFYYKNKILTKSVFKAMKGELMLSGYDFMTPIDSIVYYYENNKLISKQEFSLPDEILIQNYQYNSCGKITSIDIQRKEPNVKVKLIEQHKFDYTEDCLLKSYQKINPLFNTKTTYNCFYEYW